MSVKVATVIIIIFGIAVVIAAYLQRGEWAIGIEWVLPVIAAGIVPLKEGKEKKSERSI